MSQFRLLAREGDYNLAILSLQQGWRCSPAQLPNIAWFQGSEVASRLRILEKKWGVPRATE